MKLAVFGSPIGHSLSPVMHNAAMRHIGFEGLYKAREVDLEGFLAGVAEIRRGLLDGANVTMPHKQAAYEVSDAHSASAARAGALNTLTMEGGQLVGHNTDVPGIGSAWTAAGLPESGPVIILGAGGASAAAQVALEGRELYVVARRPGAARRLVDRVGSEAQVVAWGEPIPAGVVVNATSLGMGGEILPQPVLDAATGLFDMPYGNAPTPSVIAARSKGVPVADGLRMLVGQAVHSFRIWTGESVPESIFRDAAEAELKRREGKQ